MRHSFAYDSGDDVRKTTVRHSFLRRVLPTLEIHAVEQHQQQQGRDQLLTSLPDRRRNKYTTSSPWTYPSFRSSEQKKGAQTADLGKLRRILHPMMTCTRNPLSRAQGEHKAGVGVGARSWLLGPGLCASQKRRLPPGRMSIFLTFLPCMQQVWNQHSVNGLIN